MIAWNVGYGRLQKRRGEAMAAEAAARAGADEGPGAHGESAVTQAAAETPPAERALPEPL